MNCVIEDYLKIVTPYLHSELVSPRALSHIHTLTPILPPFSLGVFESRLKADQSRVDFSIRCFSRNIPERLRTYPVWQPLQSFYREWAEPMSSLHQGVTDVWLEFDLDGQHSHVSVPCIFLSLNQETVSEIPSLIEQAFKLLNRPVPSKLESKLRLYANSLPESATFIHFGAMLSRPAKAVRLDVGGIPPQQVLDYLVQIGWTYTTNTLASLISNLSDFVDHIVLSFDVGDTLLPRIGLECFLHKPPKHEPRWQLFLDYLVERGLCTPAKQSALFAWPGFFQKTYQPEHRPNNLTWGDYFLGYRAFSIFGRNISHIKIVYQPGIPLEAKAYLSFGHRWFDTNLLTREYLQKNECCNQTNCFLNNEY